MVSVDDASCSLSRHPHVPVVHLMLPAVHQRETNPVTRLQLPSSPPLSMLSLRLAGSSDTGPVCSTATHFLCPLKPLGTRIESTQQQRHDDGWVSLQTVSTCCGQVHLSACWQEMIASRGMQSPSRATWLIAASLAAFSATRTWMRESPASTPWNVASTWSRTWATCLGGSRRTSCMPSGR